MPITLDELKDLGQRSKRAADPESWHELMQMPFAAMRPLATNLSACLVAGDTAFRAGFVEYMLDAAAAADDADAAFWKTFWQVLCNVATGISDSAELLTPAMARALERCVHHADPDVREKCWFWLEIVSPRTGLNAAFVDVVAASGSADAALVLSECAKKLDVAKFYALPPPLMLETMQYIQAREADSVLLRFAAPAEQRLQTELPRVEALVRAWDGQSREDAGYLVSLLECAGCVAVNTGRDFTALVPAVVELLKTSRALPLVKLNQPDDALSFKSLKTALLNLLAAVCATHDAARDEVRERDGLAAVLDCCVVDSRNPFMKERAILCLRYLLQNPKNKEYVEQMHPQGVDELRSQ